jgi:serine/threonine protein kinase
VRANVPSVLRREDVLPPGSRVGGRYTLERILGGGAMGTVYAASDDSGGRFALKTLLAPDAAEERRARFLREAEVCATLRHRNIVPVVDHGVDPATGVPYLVMPLLDGEDLASVLDRVGALDPSVAAAICVQACAGLGAAHGLGVVHRDVKPSNLFLETAEGHVVVKVTDFGLAKTHGEGGGRSASGGGLTGTGRFMGTPQYVSPEQAVSAKHVDARSDVFSLAMSLYHALSGGPAFAYVRSFMGLVLEITGRESPHIQDVAPWVPTNVARIVHAALLRDPIARCPSAAELGIALDGAVGIDASRRPIAKDALQPVSDTLRLVAAPRAELVASWEELLRT